MMRRRHSVILLLVCVFGFGCPGFSVVSAVAQDTKPEPALLVRAAGKGDTKAVSDLLAKGADPNAKDGEGETALVEAAQAGHLAVVKFLLANGADPNIADGTDIRPLSAAAMFGRTAIARALLEKGADIKATDGMIKSTPLHWAASEGNVEIISLLLNKGAPVDSRNFHGGTPLLMAAMGGRYNAAKLLIEKGANVNARLDETRRLYGRAQFVGDMATMTRLEEGGALKKLRENGPSVLDWARFNKNEKLTAMLEKAGAKSGVELDRERGAGK